MFIYSVTFSWGSPEKLGLFSVSVIKLLINNTYVVYVLFFGGWTRMHARVVESTKAYF